MRNRCSVSSAIRGGPAPCLGGQPAPGGRRHLGVGRPLGVQVQPGPVGGDRLDPDRRRGPGGQRRAHRVGEAGRADPGRDHVLGHPLEPDDLVRGRARQPAELGRGGDRLRGVPGVHAQRGSSRPRPGTACSPRWRRARCGGARSRGVRRAAAGRGRAGTGGGTRTRPASRTSSRPATLRPRSASTRAWPRPRRGTAARGSGDPPGPVPRRRQAVFPSFRTRSSIRAVPRPLARGR